MTCYACYSSLIFPTEKHFSGRNQSVSALFQYQPAQCAMKLLYQVSSIYPNFINFSHMDRHILHIHMWFQRYSNSLKVHIYKLNSALYTRKKLWNSILFYLRKFKPEIKTLSKYAMCVCVQKITEFYILLIHAALSIE